MQKVEATPSYPSYCPLPDETPAMCRLKNQTRRAEQVLTSLVEAHTERELRMECEFRLRAGCCVPARVTPSAAAYRMENVSVRLRPGVRAPPVLLIV